MAKLPRLVRRLALRDIKDGVRVTIRLGPREAYELGRVAADAGETVSAVVRDSLYVAHGIGELEAEAVAASAEPEPPPRTSSRD